MSRLWLIGVVAFVVALLVGGVVVALVGRSGEESLLPAESPEGVVQRYLRALASEQYREAYGYLSADLQQRCGYDAFLRHMPPTEVVNARITLESSRVYDDRAQVKTRLTRSSSGGPFGVDESSYDQMFQLKREEGQWRVAEAGWPIWWCPPAR